MRVLKLEGCEATHLHDYELKADAGNARFSNLSITFLI